MQVKLFLNFGLSVLFMFFSVLASADQQIDYDFSNLEHINKHKGKFTKDLTNQEILDIVKEMPIFLKQVSDVTKTRAMFLQYKKETNPNTGFSLTFSGSTNTARPQYPITNFTADAMIDYYKKNNLYAQEAIKSMECAYKIMSKIESKNKNHVHFLDFKKLGSVSGWSDLKDPLDVCNIRWYDFTDYVASEKLKEYRNILQKWI